MPTDRAALLASLEKHNATFTTLLSLIPAQYYIAPTQEEADSKWMKNKKRKTGEEIKEHKRRAKASRLDPENNKTAADVLASSSTAAVASNPAPAVALPSAAASVPAVGPSRPPTASAQLVPLPPPASISSLKQKLADRLAHFRKDRGVDDDDAAQSRDALEAERRARRGEMRDKRRKGRKEERRREAESGGKMAKTQLIVPAFPSLPVDTLSYQPMSLPSQASSSSRPNLAPLKSLSNPSQALAHLQKHQDSLAKLDPERRAEVEERDRWAIAEERAGGGKVADSEKVLKKAVKRKEKMKGKSGKEW